MEIVDRLARNFDERRRIIGLLQRGAIKEIRTFERAYLPTDNGAHDRGRARHGDQYVRGPRA